MILEYVFCLLFVNSGLLILTGLTAMERFQEVKKAFTLKKVSDFRTAAYLVAIEKIAMAYDSIGL